MSRLLAGLLLFLVAAPLPAQAPADSLMQLLQQARTQRWIVRVTADSAVRHEGAVTQVSDPASRLLTSKWRSPGSPCWSGAYRVVAACGPARSWADCWGAGLGALGAAFACSMDESGDSCSEAVPIIVLIAGIGAGMGGLSAGFLGSSEWRPLWQK